MSLATRQKRCRGESFTISSPSTFRSAEFQVKEKSSKTITNPSVATLTNSEKNYLQLNPEKDLWSQVLNIRQLVSRMQKNLHQLNSDMNENGDVNSRYDLSKELSSEDSWDSADEESIINLEGILVHVSSSETSSSYQHEDQTPDDASAAASCVSSLGLGGHETTTPIHISSHHHSKSIARGNLVSPAYSESAAAAAAAAAPTPVAATRRTFQRQETDDASSVESLTTMQEFMHISKIFYFFLLEFPIHFYSFLTADSTKSSKNTRTKSPRSSKRQKQRLYLYIMLTFFILGCVVWKQCPTCFDYSTSRPSQSCVTPTEVPISPKNVTTRADFAAPLLSVHHSTMRSSKIPPPRLLSPVSPSSQDTIQLLENVVDEEDEVDVSSNTTEDLITALDPQDESSIPPKNPLIQQFQSQGKKLVQKMVKNNHKMWDQYPPRSDSTPPSTDPPIKQEVDARKQRPLVALQEKGQEVLRRLSHNNDKMWDQYPTPLPKGKKRNGGGGMMSGFLQKTANMWSDKSSDFFIAK